MHSRLIAMEERILAADVQSTVATAELSSSKSKLEAERERIEVLMEANARLRGAARSEAEWEKKSARAALKAVVLGKVSPEVRASMLSLCLLY